MIALLGAGVGLNLALADGAPLSEPLVYSGAIFRAGEPDAAARRTITIALWTGPTDGERVCSVGPRGTPLDAGRFRFVLDDAECLAGIQRHSDLWVQLTVDAETLDTRTHIAAVPYAIEAERARISQRHVLANETGNTSVGGLFCGATEPLNGALGGYVAVRARCARVSGCSPSAHLCNGDEITRSAALGITVPDGRTTGPFAYYSASTADGEVNDCDGFTRASSRFSHAWSQTAPSPSILQCDAAHPLLCCD